MPDGSFSLTTIYADNGRTNVTNASSDRSVTVMRLLNLVQYCYITVIPKSIVVYIVYIVQYNDVI